MSHHHYHCRVYSNTGQELENSTWTPIAMDAETIDEAGMHDNVTNNTRVTVPTGGGGMYLIHAQLAFLANNVGYRQARLRKNGSTTIDQTSGCVRAGAVDCHVNIITTVNLSAGDYMELEGWHNDGATLDMVPGESTTFMCVVKL